MSETTVRLPEHGRDKKQILQQMQSYREKDADYLSGKTWSLVYYLNDEHTDFLQKAYNLFFSENGLNPMAFLSLKRFESEVIRMTAVMLPGDEEAVGTMTSGGTESCLLAVKTYRDLARAKRGVRRPEMVAPETIHVAFEKAAEYFGVKLVHAPLGKDYRVDVKAMKKLINRHTVLLAASAPCYPFGVVDPIEEIGRVALRHNLPFHVDACLGGFLLPFVEKLGHDVPVFDFRVPGVTSMSADVHKYGFAAKGASTIVYRNMDYLKHQFFISENWPGGIFFSPALLGTRPGGSIAAAWAAMQAQGETGYLENARRIMASVKQMRDGIAAIPELEVLGKPHGAILAYRSKSPDLNVFAVGDQLEKRGWHIDRQQKPDSLHAMVTPHHGKVIDLYLKDLRESVAFVKAHPELAGQGGAAMYGLISHVPLRGMIRQKVLQMVMDLYGAAPKMIDPEAGQNADDWSMKAGLYYLELKKKAEKFWNETLKR
ncbi:MAG: aspartate aminotransferase family protein [Myxococcales bacterium]|nr:aspartate aminotransferase family protein [Myxococcales bacterium]